MQVAVALVETVNDVRHGPVTGAPVDVVVLTGDLTDNAQRNELTWFQLVVEGGTILPRSGLAEASSWVGATSAGSWDDRYWHPDGPPPGQPADRPTALYGFPTIPGLVDAARADVVSPGLRLPWISVHGNHDGLLQGTVPPADDLRALARGDQRITGLPQAADPLLTAEAIAEVGPARYVHDETSPRIRVPADPGRDFVHEGEFAAVTRGVEANFFVEDAGELRIICLDTVNPHGGWQGSLDEQQHQWLVTELARAREDGRRVVIASHHPSVTLTNDYVPTGAPRRILGQEVVATLLASGVVVAWIAGHVHFHAAVRHGDERRGFWEITTSSLIDWPQQARVLEFVLDEQSTEICVISTVVDHCGSVDWSAEAGFSHVRLAGISRALAANDYRLREASARRSRLDSSPEFRNVVWRSADPLAATSAS